MLWCLSATCATAWKRLHQFCKLVGTKVITDTIMLAFVAYLARQHALSTVRLYVSAIRAIAKENGKDLSSRRVDLAVKGVARAQANRTKNASKPILRPHMAAMRNALIRSNLNATDRAMAWAAIRLGFFACLRASEYTSTTATTMSDGASEQMTSPSRRRPYRSQSRSPRPTNSARVTPSGSQPPTQRFARSEPCTPISPDAPTCPIDHWSSKAVAISTARPQSRTRNHRSIERLHRIRDHETRQNGEVPVTSTMSAVESNCSPSAGAQARTATYTHPHTHTHARTHAHTHMYAHTHAYAHPHSDTVQACTHAHTLRTRWYAHSRTHALTF